jgi:hypothetical protein
VRVDVTPMPGSNWWRAVAKSANGEVYEATARHFAIAALAVEEVAAALSACGCWRRIASPQGRRWLSPRAGDNDDEVIPGNLPTGKPMPFGHEVLHGLGIADETGSNSLVAQVNLGGGSAAHGRTVLRDGKRCVGIDKRRRHRRLSRCRSPNPARFSPRRWRSPLRATGRRTFLRRVIS